VDKETLMGILGILIITLLMLLLSPIIAYSLGLRGFDLIYYSLTMIWVVLWVIILYILQIYDRVMSDLYESRPK
jgi:L-asparagine transporter-like permease